MDFSALSGMFDGIRNSKIPAAVIGGEIDGFQSIYFDDEDDMERTCEHLITAYKIKDIDILTGPQHNILSRRRVSGCKKAFEK